MTTVALLGLDLILGLIAVALWAYAAVRAQTSGLRWAMAGLLVLLVRLVTVLLLADRGWELAAERVTVGVPLALLAGTAALGLLIHARRRSRTGSTAARTALWCAAGASAVSLVLTGVVGYPGWPGAAGHNHSHSGGVAVTDLRTPPIGAARKVELVAQTQAVTLPSGRVVDAWTFGSLPGPTLTARLGETLEVTLRNRDITGGVTLHWHGLSVPNGEDGVAGVTRTRCSRATPSSTASEPSSRAPSGTTRTSTAGRESRADYMARWWCSPRPGRRPASTSCCRSTLSGRPRSWAAATRCSARWWRPARQSGSGWSTPSSSRGYSR